MTSFLSSAAQDRAFNPVEEQLRVLVADRAFNHGQVAFSAMNIDQGQMIAEYNSGQVMIPASILKLFTTWTALKTLGESYRFETTIGYTGVIENGTLNGDLIIRGGGDPTLGSRYFKNYDGLKDLFSALAEFGIERISGTVHYDLSIYHPHATPRGYVWEDMGNYFGASPSALMWQDNTIPLHFKTGVPGSPATLLTVLPEHKPYTLHHRITASDFNKDDAWFFSAPMGRMVYGEGTLPAYEEDFVVKIADPDPLFSFHEALSSGMGIEVGFERHYAPYQPDGMEKLYSIYSPPLKEIIKVTNQQSVNLFAEALMIACDTSITEKQLSKGILEVQNFTGQQWHRMLDGSGASPLNRVSADLVVQFLLHTSFDQAFDTYLSSLAVGGETGTLKWYFKDSDLKGNIKGKSGSMAATRNYAGYLTNRHGERIAFALLMNDYDDKRKNEVIQAFSEVLRAMVEF